VNIILFYKSILWNWIKFKTYF